VNVNAAHSEQPFWIPMVAGSTARIWAATLVSPLELIRTKMQSQKLSYAGLFVMKIKLLMYIIFILNLQNFLKNMTEITQALKRVVEYSGMRGLWMGLGSTLLRDVPFSAIYWFNYESIKKAFSDSQQNFAFNFVSGAVAGSVSSNLNFITSIHLSKKIFYK
jgi:solute carrier family 25 protein 39/40